MTVKPLHSNDVIAIGNDLHFVTAREIVLCNMSQQRLIMFFLMALGQPYSFTLVSPDGQPVAMAVMQPRGDVGVTWLALSKRFSRHYRGVIRTINRLTAQVFAQSGVTRLQMRKVSDHPQAEKFLQLIGFRAQDEQLWVKENHHVHG